MTQSKQVENQIENQIESNQSKPAPVKSNFKKYELFKDLVLDKTKELGMFDSKPENIEQSFSKICEIWNKDQKSRNFVKHLIASFLPIDTFNKLFFVPEEDKEKFKCAIMNFNVTGVKNFASETAPLGVRIITLKAKTFLGQENSEEEIAEYNNMVNSLSIEVKERRIGYTSEKSDKYLSQDAIIGLFHFATYMIMADDKEVCFTVNKSRLGDYQEKFEKNKQLEKNEINKISKATTFGVRSHLDDKTMSALEKLKVQLESSSSEKN